MIPIQLTLQGIYSYQEKQTIDFSKLTEANLFGIFGSVGSGKSTILKAITYALYGNTDRLNQKGDNRNYNMMNLKSNELFIEFIFRTGKDDTEYMATVKGRRNSKQFEEVKALDRGVYKKENGKWIPIETDTFSDIIGLSYENFKRTVIIPQGRFQEFLQLGNSDRTRMMKELFNLEKFELFYKVVSLESKNNQQIQSLQGQMLQLGDINPEQIKTLENSLAELKTHIEEKTKELKHQQILEEQFRKQKELTEKIDQTTETLVKLKSQEPEYILLEKTIQEYEYCLLNFRNLLESLQKSSDKITLQEKKLQTDQETLTKTQQQLKELEESFLSLKSAYEGRETYKQQAEEYEKIATILELELISQQIQLRLKNGEKVISETEEKMEKLQSSKAALKTAVDEIKTQMPDMTVLALVKNWFTLQNTLLSTQKGLLNEMDAIQLNIQDIDKQKVQLCKNNNLENRPSRDIDVLLEDRKTQLKKNLENLNKDIEHLSVQTKLEEYAANLEEGHECPLCGALNHPNPLNARNVPEALQNTRQKKIETETVLTTLESLQKKFSELNTSLKFKQELQQSIHQKQRQNEAEITGHQKNFSWATTYQDENSVNYDFENANQLQQQLKTKETEQENIGKTLETETKNKEKFNQVLEEFRHQLTGKTSEIATLTGQIKLLKLADLENTPTGEIRKAKETSLLKYLEIEKTYTTANDKINALGKERDALTVRLEVNHTILAQEVTEKKALHNRIQSELEKSIYRTLPEVEAILRKPLNTEAEKNKLKQFRDSLKRIENELGTLQKNLGNQKYDSEQHQGVLEILSKMEEELNQAKLNQGKLAGELENLKKEFETLKTLSNQRKALELRAEDLKTLKQLFKASGFVNYISSVYLQELCQAANNRFYKLTRQKLSLEVTGDNNFQVRDFMNGGKTRNVKTLSGGQTFQAALSLALALADNIQKITESNQNFFFLDEGFGSLDKESLDVVFDTLKSLRKENRIVGVISHVEEMQQEIDTHLKITNDEDRGSLIKPSWA